MRHISITLRVNSLEKELQFDILIRQPKGYEAAKPKAGWRCSPVFGRRFKLTRERNRVGDWGYTGRGAVIGTSYFVTAKQ